MTEYLAMRDMECAMDTVAVCRRLASEYGQLGFKVLADYYTANARAAEKWLVAAGKCYPKRCDASGRAIWPRY